MPGPSLHELAKMIDHSLLQLTLTAATVSTASATNGFRKTSVARLLMRVAPIHESHCQRNEIVACDGLPRARLQRTGWRWREEQIHEAERRRAGWWFARGLLSLASITT